MMVLLIEALAAIAPCLSVLTAGAWLVPQRIGKSGRIDRARDARYRNYRLRTGMFFPLPPKGGVVA